MSKPVYTLQQVEQELQWNWGGAEQGTTESWHLHDIDYSIPSSSPPSTIKEADGFVAPTDTQLACAREAFELWDDLIAINLNEVDSPNAHITLALSSTTGSNDKDGNFVPGGTYTSTALAGQPSGSSTFAHEITSANVWLDASWDEHQSDDMAYAHR